MSQVWVVCFLLLLSADVAKMNDVNRISVHLRSPPEGGSGGQPPLPAVKHSFT